MNQQFKFIPTRIDGLIKILTFNAEDIRGCLTKDYSRQIFAEHGIQYELMETFYTTSYKGVIRALHFQREKQQPKLIRCIDGHIWDVVVDLRKKSPTFRDWISFDLRKEIKEEILIPAGCAHGYLVLEDSIVSYKCAEEFYAEYDDGILYNDSDIGVKWPLDQIGGKDNIILAEKDKDLQTFKEFLDNYGGF